MKPLALCLGFIALVLGTSTCTPPPCDVTGPECAGWLSITFDTPVSGDGGVMFRVSGGRVDSATAVGNLKIFPDGLASSSVDIIVAGNLQDGPVARIFVPNEFKAGLYAVEVIQVAAGGTWEQRDPSGYVMTISR